MLPIENNVALSFAIWKVVDLLKDFWNLFHVKILKEKLYVILVKALQNSVLNPKMCCSQIFEGAGNMSGKPKRGAAQCCLKTENKKGVYFRRAFYKLNFCFSSTPKVPQVSKIISKMQLFERQRKIKLLISLKILCSNILKSKVKPMCEKRWIERHTSSGLLKQLQNLVFIISLQTFCYIYGYIKGFPKKLRGSWIEIIKSYELVFLAVEQLSNIPSNDVKKFQLILKKGKKCWIFPKWNWKVEELLHDTL